MQVRVVAAVVQRQNRYLICQRPLAKRHGGLWEFPGGKAEEGESDADALSRELREELDVRVLSVANAMLSLSDPNSTFLIAFCPAVIDGEPVPREHLQICWVTLPELLQADLAPTDRVFATHLAARATSRDVAS